MPLRKSSRRISPSPSGKLMQGQDNSVCTTVTSKAEINQEIRMTPLLITALGLLMVATAFLSGLFGMAGGLILIGVLLTILPLPSAMVLHAITQIASNGWRAFLWRRPAIPHLGDAADHDGGELLHHLWKLAAAGAQQCARL
jgi:hypothetical protein